MRRPAWCSACRRRRSSGAARERFCPFTQFQPSFSFRALKPIRASPQSNPEEIMPIKKILSVDDSPTDRQFLLEKLSKHGYQGVTAESGDEAIAKSKSEQPDLVLMDVVMPGTNGYEATRAIARDEATQHIPAIIRTGTNQA